MPVANSTPAPVIKATFIDAQAIYDQQRAQAQAEAQARAEEQRKRQAAEQRKRQEAAARKAREKKAREAAEAKRQSELRRLAEQKARERCGSTGYVIRVSCCKSPGSICWRDASGCD